MKSSQKGFLILEVFIASLILTSSIAATMYLFRIGMEGLQRANDSNVLSSKLPEAVNLLAALDLSQKQGEEYLGNDVSMRWESALIGKTRPVHPTAEGIEQSLHELYLYNVILKFKYQNLAREYTVNVFRYKPLSQASEF